MTPNKNTSAGFGPSRWCQIIVCWLAMPAILTGCALMQLKTEVETRERSVADKEEQLRIEATRREQLTEDARLLDERRNAIRKQMADLSSSLQEARKNTELLKATTHQDAARKRDAERQIQRIQRDMDVLDAQPDTQAKQERIKQLEEEIDTLLRIPLGLPE